MKRPLSPYAMLALAVSLALSANASASRFKVLALAEAGGHHIAFTEAAKPWLAKCGSENGFDVDYITNTTPITTNGATGPATSLARDGT